MTNVVIHVSKLFNQARQFAVPGNETKWVSRRLAKLFKDGKLIGFVRSSDGESWTKTQITEVPARIQFRGVPQNVAEQISLEFWKELSKEKS